MHGERITTGKCQVLQGRGLIRPSVWKRDVGPR